LFEALYILTVKPKERSHYQTYLREKGVVIRLTSERKESFHN